MLDPCKWPIFSVLGTKELRKIKKLCVFGSSGNESIYITDDDDVYALGSNSSACLALGDTNSTFEPKKIESLCKKNVVDIAFGSGPHVLAVTADGEIYSWGHNGYCQIGNGGSGQVMVPILVNTNLQGRKVTKVACGSHHSMALTSEGEVYSWGQNNCGQVGSGTTTNQPMPRKIMAVIGSKIATSIACGQTSSMALIENGEVYGWGYNGNGQLGLGNNVNQPNPSKVQGLQGIIVYQLVCGYAHTLALSDEGTMYTWGANSYGQLGSGNKANQVSPTKVDINNERIIEVCASHYAHISACLTETGHVYMWGQCKGQSITSPSLTRFSCTDDVLAAFASPPVTWRMYVIDCMKGSKIAEDISKSFDDVVTADIKFQVEGKQIHVHKSILKIRCSHFQNMFQSCWEEDGKDTIEISQYSYETYKAFLEYLYTDLVCLKPEEAIGLLDLANAYCESTLKKHCEQIIKKGITVENVAMLYAAAIKYDAKDLEEFCYRFCLNHMTAVTQTEAFSHLDEHVVKEFIRKAAQSGAFKY